VRAVRTALPNTFAALLSSNSLGGAGGTVPWTSPENFNPRSPHFAKPPADVWSFGCVLYELLSGRVPFHEVEGMGPIIAAICSGQQLDFPAAGDARLVGLARRCMHMDPAARPTAGELVALLSEWASQGRPLERRAPPAAEAPPAPPGAAGAEGLGGQGEGGWACAACTLINALGRQSCEACGGARGGGRGSALAFSPPFQPPQPRAAGQPLSLTIKARGPPTPMGMYVQVPIVSRGIQVLTTDTVQQVRAVASAATGIHISSLTHNDGPDVQGTLSDSRTIGSYGFDGSWTPVLWG
jgi:hypothetical protein